MKKMLLISCVMLALTATAAVAGNLNISWGPECASDVLVTNKNFACLSNSGSNAMIASFLPTLGHEFLLAVDGVIDMQPATGAVIPNWWQFKNVGACRLTSLSAGATPSGAAVACADVWSGQATATIDYYGDQVWNGVIPVPVVAGNRARIKVGCSIPIAAASAIDAGLEYYAFTVTFNNARTVGTGLCTGCLVPAALVFNSIAPGYQDGTAPAVFSSEQIITPLVNNCITWQGGAAGLCLETPAQNKTWGQVKSLYR